MPDKELTRAGFGPRAAAYIIDRALLFIALAIVRLPFSIASLLGANGLTAKSFLFQYSVLDVVCWLLVSAYFVLLTWFCGGTLGKLVMRLQVRRADGGAMRFIDILYRETVGRFLSGILCLGYIMALADKENRAFHDWLCGTCVVYDGVTIPARGKKTTASADYGWSVPAAEPIPEADPQPMVPGWSVPAEEPLHEEDPLPEADPQPAELPAAEPGTETEREA